ncbi:hypothetical protein TIFTF001_017433 [Ficus carica]|uniref:Uncharacterized protein n=1 Tax=Ficus carica TaxID=3494 RepID=A0AA88DAR4_FICCA|nr:hypothetical protein TIFTF001_017433 [Ficus carica]
MSFSRDDDLYGQVHEVAISKIARPIFVATTPTMLTRKKSRNKERREKGVTVGDLGKKVGSLFFDAI